MLGQVRIKVPTGIARGSVARVRVVCIHPNERVERQGGKSVDKNYRFINRVVVSYLGRDIAELDTSTPIGDHPASTIPFRATEPGPLNTTFCDTHGPPFVGTVDVKPSRWLAP